MIEHGHRFNDLIDYSWSQFVVLYQSAVRRQRQVNQEQFNMMFVAMRGNEESVKAMFASFSSGVN